MLQRQDKRILCWNGIESNGSGSTDLFAQDLRALGYNALDVNYPKVSWYNARSKERLKANAHTVLSHHLYGDSVIAHSYGCAVALEAMRMGANFRHVFLFSPAIDSDIDIPRFGADSITVFYNRRDRAIFAGMLLPWHTFGAMGRYGYRGKQDPRVTNVAYRNLATGKSFLNHSLYFHDDHRQTFVNYVDNKLHPTF